ncbi:MAG: 4-hydroxythreonine-4-phosphate dehydrogenase PdxA [Lentisphaeria bacterium]|nr:4-hydroxythreonine-4-phosphate dehydrogenase PdxA [Lentisphaeria bacterium]
MITIALTMGDPAGIGPELAVRAAAEKRWQGKIRFVLYGERSILQAAADRWTNGQLPEVVSAGVLPFAELVPGRADARCGKLAYDALTLAAKDVLNGKADAIVTAPMNKYSVNLAGIPFTGHTERLAELCQTPDYVMMQSSGKLRMVFVTCHIPLAEVPKRATQAEIVRVTRLLYRAVQQEGIPSPRLAMAAINPHAGENGCMGLEDETNTKPALAQLRAEGMDIEGPFPPDTLFVKSARERFDGLITMYHDQGHIPFKMLAFDSGVNSTLGLPIIRTSPDHGTAFDIAWKGCADTGSLYAAVELAYKRACR